MKTSDEELIQQLRSELDGLTAGVRGFAGDPPPPQPSAPDNGADHGRRWMAAGIAAATITTLVGGLVVLANRDAGDSPSDAPPAGSEGGPAVTPATPRYEVIAPVLETRERGTQLCLG